MEVRSYLYLPENAKRDVNLDKRLSKILKSLDTFLIYLQKHKPKIYDKYLMTLQSKLRSLLVKSEISLQKLSIPIVQKSLRAHIELHTLYLTYAVQLMDLQQDLPSTNNSDSNIDILWINYDKSGVYPSYYRALVLCEILGREKAINFLKRYIDWLIPMQIKPDLKAKDLDPFWEKWEQNPKAKNARPSHFIEFRLHKGKWGGKVFRCLIHDVMKPLNDPELAFILACYGDKAQIEAMNPNFVFTRTKTLMQGDSFCDGCIHDKRHAERIEHPNEDFYKNLDLNVEH